MAYFSWGSSCKVVLVHGVEDFCPSNLHPGFQQVRQTCNEIITCEEYISNLGVFFVINKIDR